MFNIANYLEKFKNIGQGERLIKEIIVLAIKEVCNLEIEQKSVVLKNGEVMLKISPGLKNAIFIKKEAILNRIKDKTSQPVNDIR